MDLPIYCVVDTYPVKVVGAEDGTIEVLAFDPVEGEFVRRMELLERVLMQDDWVVELTEDEFEMHLSNLRDEHVRRAG